MSTAGQSFTAVANSGTCQSWCYDRLRQYIWIFPLLFALTVPLFCLSFYSYAASYGHLEPWLQYVSDSGSYSPSAGYFAESLDILAILVLVTTYARYKQQKFYIDVKVPSMIGINTEHRSLLERLGRYNFYSLLLGYLNVFALFTVANFRCNEVFVVHAIAAFTMFHCSFFSTGLMIYICRALSSHFGIESAPVTMTAGLIAQLLSLIGCIVFSTVAMFQFGYDNFFDEYKRLHWTIDQRGYWWHVLGTGFEWSLLNSTSILFLCLFRRMRLFSDWLKVDL